jgi:hypothetical protein
VETPKDDNQISISDFRDEGPIAHTRESTRKSLAFQLLWLISALCFAVAAGVISHALTIDAAKDLALILFSPVVSIFAIVVGFFFGEERR